MKKPPGDRVLYPELAYKIMEIAFEVHNGLGPGFTEDIYERAFILELTARNIPFAQQKPVEVYYKDQLMGIYRLDLVIDEKVIVELKAITALADIHKQQLLSYLKATGLRLGILINFGTTRVQHFRIAN